MTGGDVAAAGEHPAIGRLHRSAMVYEPFPDTFPVLVGEGLVLRELCEADLPAWFERLSDPGAAALAGDPIASSMNTVVEGLAHHRRAFHEQTGLRWSIVPEEVGASVGTVGFVQFDQDRRTAEIGGSIGRTHWGRGIATRAGRIVTAYGLGALALETIEAVVLAENLRTLRVLEKLGFTKSPQPCPPGRRINGRADSGLFVLRAEDRAAQSGRRAVLPPGDHTT